MEAIRAELEAITNANDGRLLAENVVDYARDPDTTLHDQFDWDDTAAADKWRLHRARNIILKVRVTISRGDDRAPVSIRAFVSLNADRGDRTGYRVTTAVLSDVDLRASLLAEAKDEMQGFRRKYRALSELADVFEAMKRVRRRRTSRSRQGVAG